MLKKSNYILMDDMNSNEVVHKLEENSNCKNIAVTQQSNNVTLVELELTFYKYKITIASNKINTEAKLKKTWLIINICCYAFAIAFMILNVIYPIVVCIVIAALMYIERKDFDEYITNTFNTLDS